MAKLTTKRRKALATSKFALPDKRAYPVDTKARAQNAKARAQQEFDKGNLSASDKARIDRAANRVLKQKGAKTINGKPIRRKTNASKKR
jgi:hypothetical protein